MAAAPRRLSPRIMPPRPITVAIEEEHGSALGYGVIVDISGSGAHVWSDAHIAVGAALQLRISFTSPPEVHGVIGAVVWARPAPRHARKNASQYGVEWLIASYSCRARLRELANRAVPPLQGGRLPFERAWTVRDDSYPI